MPTSSIRSRLNANHAKIFRFVKERASVKLAREAAAAKKRKHAFAKIAQVQKNAEKIKGVVHYNYKYSIQEISEEFALFRSQGC